MLQLCLYFLFLGNLYVHLKCNVPLNGIDKYCIYLFIYFNWG